MFIVAHRKIFFLISGILVAVALILIAVRGLQFGIDFLGGSIIEVVYTENRPPIETLNAEMSALSLGEVKLQSAGERELIVRTTHLEEKDHSAVLNALSLGGTAPFTEQRFNSIGPVIGKELRSKAVLQLI